MSEKGDKEVKGDQWDSVSMFTLTFDLSEVSSTSTFKKLMLNILQILKRSTHSSQHASLAC